MRFDDGEVRDDICLDSAHTPVRFDAAAYHAVVEVQYDGSWYRGRLVKLIKGSVVWGVAFEDGDWAEDVRLGIRMRHIRKGSRCGQAKSGSGGWSESRWKRCRRAARVLDVRQGLLVGQQLAVHMRVHSRRAADEVLDVRQGLRAIW